MERKVRILVWFKGNNFVVPLFKHIDSAKAEVKGMDEFGIDTSLWSQRDFDRIEQIFHPDMVVLHLIGRNGLPINIPDHIYVCTYADHFFESLNIIGKGYFNILHERDFIYFPLLNAETIDVDQVLQDTYLRKKLITAPFTPFVTPHVINDISTNSVSSTTDSDLAIITTKKNINYYNYTFDLNGETSQGRALMHLMQELVVSVQNELYMQEKLNLEESWIEKEIISLFDTHKIWQYARDRERLLEIWIRAVKNIVVSTENTHVIARWLTEAGYNIKLYGKEWDKYPIFQSHAMGELEEMSNELYVAYQNSKIIINTNTVMGIHRKTFETIQFGCLNMQADAEPTNMASNVQPYFKDGESIVIFHNKKELFDKVDFYLSNDSARQSVITKSQEVLKKLNWDINSVINNVFDQLAARMNLVN